MDFIQQFHIRSEVIISIIFFSLSKYLDCLPFMANNRIIFCKNKQENVHYY